MKKSFSFILFILFSAMLMAQRHFPPADSLRGSLRPQRTCYDVTYYDLDLEVDLDKRSISGKCLIRFNVVEATQEIQVDLFENMPVHAITLNGSDCTYERVHNAIFIKTTPLRPGASADLAITYSGKPKTARMPPWDGGFIWDTDPNGKPWVGVACEGIGASLWWPNKDHLSDEPDSMSIRVTVPDHLFCVSNGNLRQVAPAGRNRKKYSWHVQYPINNYNVTINIGDYANFSDTYYSKTGDSLDLSYYVLRDNVAKARSHFRQVHGVLEAFEYYFGKYPFWDDGFCLVETPYLGMEHQSAIAYGNKYQRGYLGGMIPREFDFDYIIVHEAGHEYWGNCISASDLAELWIHESFTTYMESLYVEYLHGKEAAERYLRSQKNFILNREPIIGPHGVNHYTYMSSDHYYKGAWVLHTLRMAIENDEKWFSMLRSLYQTHACSVVQTEDILGFFEEESELKLQPFFRQYLYTAQIPVLRYQFSQEGRETIITYYWENVVDGFEFPFFIGNGQVEIKLEASSTLRKSELPFHESTDVKVIADKGYYRVKAGTPALKTK